MDIDPTWEVSRNENKLRGVFDTGEALDNKLRDDLFHVFWTEGARLTAANPDGGEARIYFDEAKRLLFLH